MKKLSLIFGVIAILVLLFGIYFLFTLSGETQFLAFGVIMSGFILTALFLITDNITCN